MIISFNAYRGGNGKTTLAINLAYMLARQDKKILLMDSDGGAPALQDYLWNLIPAERRPQRFYVDYLMREKEVEFEECIATAEANGTTFDVVFVAPKRGVSPEALLAIQRREFGLLSEEYRRLADAFDYAVNRGYHHVLVDASCGYDICNLMIVASVSEMIVLVARAHKIDLEETLVYNFMGIRQLLEEKLKMYPMSRGFVKLIVNEVVDPIFTQEVVNDILETNQIPKRSVEDSILGKVKYYPELRLDRNPAIFCASNPTHPLTKQLNDIASKISQM